MPVSDITGNLDITGYVSASSSITAGGAFYGDGSNLSGVAGAAITQYVSANSLTVLGSPGVSTITRLGATDLNVTGIITANGLSGNVTGSACTFTTGTFNGNVTIGGTLTYEDVTNVDALGIITARAGVNVSGGELLVGSNIKGGTAGVLTATSFSGSGANLTSLPSTTPTTITVADESSDTTCFPSFFTAATGDLAPKTGSNLTFNSSSGALTATSVAGNIVGGTVAGSTGTFSGAVNVDDTTDSTSSTTGALIVDGGLGVAKNVYIGAGLSVAGTLTYEDVTNVDSVGLITAKSGVNVSGGQVTIGTGITMGIAGVATFSGTSDVHLKDNVRLNIGDGSDIAFYFDGTNSNLDANSGGVFFLVNNDFRLRTSGAETMLRAQANGTVEVMYDNATKLETTAYGGMITDNDASAELRFTSSAGRVGSVWGNSDTTFGLLDGQGHYLAAGTKDAEFSLYYDNSSKLATTGYGVTLSGGACISGLTTAFGGLTVAGTMVESMSSTTTAYNTSGDLNITNGNFHFNSANLGGTGTTLNIMSTTGINTCLLYTSPSPRDVEECRIPCCG